MKEPVLETERLTLRELHPGDVDALSEVLGDPWTMRFYPHPFSREEVVGWIERGLVSYRANGFWLWAAVLKETGQVIGDTGLTIQTVDGEDLVEVGWHVHRRFQRQGLATEAGRASIDHGFGTLGLDRIISLIRPENVPSWKVAEKLGMHVWKETDRAHLRHRVYLLERADWEASSPGSRSR
ncbi:MAG: GNAT family N-acetyltransferase [Actinomycetota bacterium]|nr:GNAT family N-acetyltransferase [Actinomycetota bacterium]